MPVRHAELRPEGALYRAHYIASVKFWGTFWCHDNEALPLEQARASAQKFLAEDGDEHVQIKMPGDEGYIGVSGGAGEEE